MENNHKPQQLYPEKVFKIMSSLFFSNLKLQFSDRHNSLYGYNDFLARLFNMCRYGQYAETAYNSRFIKDAKSQCKRIPCGKSEVENVPLSHTLQIIIQFLVY